MRRTWAMIENGVVKNVALWDGESRWDLPEGITLVEVTNEDPIPGPDWTYDSTAGSFVEPIRQAPEPIPTPAGGSTGGPTVVAE